MAATKPPPKPKLIDEVVIVGATPHPFRDLYHWLMKASWVHVLGLVATSFLAINALYAVAYMQVGGIANAAPGSWVDAFFFSVQTMGTIGYGSMYPTSLWANLLVTSEAVVGLLVTAVATGLVFQRVSQPRAQVVFSSRLAICVVDGVPTLMGRLGNDRNDAIVNAQLNLDCVRTVVTKEGTTMYRSAELKLVRSRASSLSRTWNVQHVIDQDSPLFGLTPESAKAVELEAVVSVFGVDEVTNQTVHARERYRTQEIVFGARLVDLLSELPDGRLQLDVRRFDDLEPTPATEAFPWSWSGGAQ
jgi:inward rectifier potassium channel